MTSPLDSQPLITAVLSSLKDTAMLADVLVAHLPRRACLGLVGTLGAGKTRLVQSVALAVGVPEEAATSPTFTLVQTYQGQRFSGLLSIHHIDAYRINDDDEFLELGIEEMLEEPDTLTLIEWADRVKCCLPADTLWIRLELFSDSADPQQSTRRAQFFGDASIWQNLVQQMVPAELRSQCE